MSTHTMRMLRRMNPYRFPMKDDMQSYTLRLKRVVEYEVTVETDKGYQTAHAMAREQINDLISDGDDLRLSTSDEWDADSTTIVKHEQ